VIGCMLVNTAAKECQFLITLAKFLSHLTDKQQPYHMSLLAYKLFKIVRTCSTLLLLNNLIHN
jgi:hypothetical protein